MKRLLLTLSVLFLLNSAFAETYVCSFRQDNAAMRVRFDFDSNMENAKVTIYRGNSVQISHQTKGRSDGYGDGWDLVLRDRNHPQYKYHLFFDALYLDSVVLSMPGMPKQEIDNCRRLRSPRN